MVFLGAAHALLEELNDFATGKLIMFGFFEAIESVLHYLQRG